MIFYTVNSDGKIKTKNDFYNDVILTLKLPKYFGKNLDAFEDIFRGGIAKVDLDNSIIVIKNYNKLIDHLGNGFMKKICNILNNSKVHCRIEF